MAVLIGCSQSQLSKVENGKAPLEWTWEPYIAALGYANGEAFAAGLRKARKLKALRTPAAEEFPLGQFASRTPDALTLAMPQAVAPAASEPKARPA